MRIAAIDLGSNSLHMVLADTDKAGTFRASVEVTDASGDSDSDYVDIEIGAE